MKENSNYKVQFWRYNLSVLDHTMYIYWGTQIWVLIDPWYLILWLHWMKLRYAWTLWTSLINWQARVYEWTNISALLSRIFRYQFCMSMIKMCGAYQFHGQLHLNKWTESISWSSLGQSVSMSRIFEYIKDWHANQAQFRWSSKKFLAIPLFLMASLKYWDLPWN